jgi:type VI secretion system protein ImpK
MSIDSIKNKQINLGNNAQVANTESFDIEQAARRPLTEPVTIHHATSTAFDSQFSLNPLVAAAAPILMITNKIQSTNEPINPEQLLQELIKEIKIFENKARQLEYRSAIILAARYFLSSYVDEMITSHANSSIKNVWQAQPLLKTLQGEIWGGERFFLILERASDDSDAHIDLLELGYLCINLGYQGRYKNENLRELEHIKDNLFVLITNQRGEPNDSLFIGKEIQTPMIINAKKQNKRVPHVIFAAVILVAGITAVYLPYTIHLQSLAKKTQQKIAYLLKRKHQGKP